MCVCERERGGGRDRQAETVTERDQDRETETDREIDTEREIQTDRDRQTQRDRDRERDRDRQTDRQTDTDRQTQRDRERDRERQRDRQRRMRRKRQTERQRKVGVYHFITQNVAQLSNHVYKILSSTTALTSIIHHMTYDGAGEGRALAAHRGAIVSTCPTSSYPARGGTSSASKRLLGEQEKFETIT